MDIAKNVARWIILIGFIGLSLPYLNSTVFSLWAAGGPPTDIPNAWLHRALVHFGFSVTLIVTAISAFIILRPGFSFKGKKIVYIWVVVVAVAIGYPQQKNIF